MPKTTGTVMAIPINTAFEKLLLLRNSNNSLTLFVMKFEMEIAVLVV
ncbi:hypothetical protein [Xanthomarina sp. GH4-25]